MGWNRHSRYASPRMQWDDALSRMDPLEFERLIAEHFRRGGWQVEHAGTGGSARLRDGGIDLKLRRDNELVIVQCKRYNRSVVTHNPMHELIGVMQTAKATGAILVNSGEFSDYARKMASQEPRLRLIDGAELRKLLGDLLPTGPTPERTWEPVGAPASNPAKASGTYRSKPKQPTGAEVLMKIALLFGLLFWLKFCASAKLAAISAHPQASNTPPRATAPQREPAIQALPQPVPSQPTPPQQSDRQRPYQTPDEAIKVLEESTPKI